MDLIDTHLHLIDRSVTGHAWTHQVPALQLSATLMLGGPLVP